ncbi:hypothetical protein GCM10010211_42410 [Streptomyces albospinus]|uniref:Uncharacterized protein n=1 Tax=Streptomyces albospinus TaxID=285515 RepID=A0ABQ2VAU0_9ACTN|nr:hypothetical protein [Streptomyces albospinus]GGU72065.1 hypothetical protein GCM10010211_42410 [Streptomyces albospinus]
MKYAKSAAVVAGSVMALGAVVPAFAANPGSSHTSHKGGVADAMHNKHLESHQITPLVETVKNTAETVKYGPKRILGGATGATKKGSLLGGLPVK